MRMEDLAIASVDDHIVEPPDMFGGHLPADVEQPRVVEQDGKQAWLWDDLIAVNIGLNAVVGRPRNEWGMEPARFDHMRKAAWDVDARVDDGAAARREAEVPYGHGRARGSVGGGEARRRHARLRMADADSPQRQRDDARRADQY